MISWIPVAVFVIAAFAIVGLLLKALKESGNEVCILMDSNRRQHQIIKTYEEGILTLEKDEEALEAKLAVCQKESIFHKERWHANANEALQYRSLLEQREKQVQRLKNVKKKKKVRR